MSAALQARELTARGRGAIRVLELAGPGALERVRSLVAPASPRGPFFLARLRDRETGELLDEAVVVLDSPERVELHLHGSAGLVERVTAGLGLSLASTASARSLEELAEEALATSASEAAARMLLDQAQGALRRALDELLLAPAARRASLLRELVERGRVARCLVAPPRVVLAGAVNAGKSTLFNALVGRERVVVDESAGTTRDAVAERVLLGEYAVDLVDTAGEREMGDSTGPEVEGQRLARELAARSDLVLWLDPVRGPSLAPPALAHVRRVHSRADEVPGSAAGASLSALRDPLAARAIVEELLHESLRLPRDPWHPGAAVPFVPAVQAALEAALSRPDESSAAAAVAAWTRAR